MKKRVILFRIILAIMLSTVGLTVWAGLPHSSEAAVWGYLRGLVFDDANWNGEIDPGEGAIHDVGVRISAGHWSAFTTTGWDGTFGFAALNTGRYAVEVIIPETYSATTPVVVYRDITVGDQSVLVTGVDFGMTTALKAVGEYVPRFEQGSCPFKVSEGAVVECGFVVVPEDHSDPTGPTIRLAVAVLKDHSEEHQPDPVMLLTGGPGEKTVHNAPAIARIFAPIHPNRDFIVFDQRGVGLSEPALECPEFVQALFDLLDEPDPNVHVQTIFDALMTCRDRLVSEGYNLSAYNTVQNAADVNAIRFALGYDQVNLYGGSYGSLLAQATMRDHPKGIRSVAINSVLPLEKSLFVEGTMTTANAVLRLLKACAADEACNSAYPNLQDVLFEVIDRLNAEPIPITVTNPLDGQSYDAVLTGDAVLGNLVTFLYVTQIIPVLPQAIYDVHNEDYQLMTQLSSTRLALLDLISRGMTLCVFCTDDLIGRTPEDLLNIRAALPRQLVGGTDPEVTIEYGNFGICENWPVEEADPWVKEPLESVE